MLSHLGRRHDEELSFFQTLKTTLISMISSINSHHLRLGDPPKLQFQRDRDVICGSERAERGLVRDEEKRYRPLGSDEVST